MTISEKVAYIQGMFDGMELDKSDSKEARVLSEVLDLLKEMAEEMENIDATLDEFGEEIDAISDDLSDVEDAVFEDEDDEDDDEEDEEDFFEMECPNCGEDLFIDDEVLEEGVVECPNCGQRYALSCDEVCAGDCDGCSCECGEDEE